MVPTEVDGREFLTLTNEAKVVLGMCEISSDISDNLRAAAEAGEGAEERSQGELDQILSALIEKKLASVFMKCSEALSLLSLPFSGKQPSQVQQMMRRTVDFVQKMVAGLGITHNVRGGGSDHGLIVFAAARHPSLKVGSVFEQKHGQYLETLSEGLEAEAELFSSAFSPTMDSGTSKVRSNASRAPRPSELLKKVHRELEAYELNRGERAHHREQKITNPHAFLS